MRKVLLFLTIPVLFALSCAKEKSFEEGIDGNSNYETSWQFKDTSVLFGGNATSYELDTTGTQMEYEGGTTDGLGTINIKLQSLVGVLKQGSYQSKKGEVEFSYMSGGAPRYEASLLDSIGENLTVTILSIDSASVIGFFTGTARTASGTIIPITEGKFNYRKVELPSTDSSVGTLGSSADTCTGAAIAGTYYKAVPMATSNTVSVNVNITKTGAYSIVTDTVKGFYFSKTGTFSTLGTQTVVLNGAGTPSDSGTAKFTVKYGASKCSFDIKVDTIATSEGTLGASATNCTGVALAGTFQKNTALTVGNTVTIEVNITKAGFYSITTDTIKGFYFNKTGTFAAAGQQTVVLNGFGTPSDSGSTKFTVKYGTTSCGFTVPVAAAPIVVPPAEFYFQFNDGTSVVSATPDITTIEQISGFTIFDLGASSASGDSSYAISITSSSALKTGVSYVTTAMLPPLATFVGNDNTIPVKIYGADFATAGSTMTIKFDVIDLTGKVVSGTFSGTAKDALNATKTITLGKFRASLQ